MTFTGRTSAQAVPVCMKILSAPSTLYLKTHCGLNTSWTFKLALLKLTFEHNRNIYYEAWGRDNLPKEIRGKARWTKIEDRDWSYVIHAEGKPCSLEYINDAWYQTGWSADAQRYFTNSSQKIKHPEQFGLETKGRPILSTEDKKCLEKAPTIEELSDGQEEGPSIQERRLGNLDPEIVD